MPPKKQYGQEDLDKLAEQLQERRAKLAELTTTREAKERDQSLNVQGIQMQAELDQLDAAIKMEQARSTDKAIREGAANTLDAATVAMNAAAAAAATGAEPEKKKE